MIKFKIENLEDLVVVAKSLNEALDQPQFTKEFFVSINSILPAEITEVIVKEYSGDNEFIKLHSMTSESSYSLRIHNIVFNIKADPDSPKPVKNIYNFANDYPKKF